MSYSLVATLVAAVAGLATALAWKHARAQSKRARAAEAAVAQRDHVIRRMEEVNSEAAKQHREIRTGSADDQFSTSLDIMRDDPGRAGKPGA